MSCSAFSNVRPHTFSVPARGTKISPFRLTVSLKTLSTKPHT